jgi:hypothetical protein
MAVKMEKGASGFPFFELYEPIAGKTREKLDRTATCVSSTAGESSSALDDGA